MVKSNSSLLNSLQEFASNESNLPPVEQWDPEFCGDIDIEIKSNGQWLHQGTPIARKQLFILFSRVLIKQEEQYFLITPVEKLAIQVEWQPFVIVDFEIFRDTNQEYIVMVDNCDNKIRLNNAQQLQFSQFQGLSLPIINVRKNLFASFSRNCYYRLIEQATTIKHQQHETLHITSAEIDFCLGKIDI